jgi:hypothetical protein
MSTNETHIAWRPDDLHSSEMNIVSLTDDAAGFRILLQSFPPSSSSRMLQIRFEVLRAYRVIDEGDRVGQPFRPDRHSLIYKVENSMFLDEFHRLSAGMLRTFDLVHYFIVSVNDCVDVLAETEPTLEWLP